MNGTRFAKRFILGFCTLAAIALLPAVASPFVLRVGQTLLFGAALATAWNILGGFAGYWSFGNAAFLGLGAFVAALFQEHAPIADPMLRFLSAVAVGGSAAAVLGLIIGYPILRLRGPYFAIAMLGVSLVLSELSSSVDLFEGALGISIDTVTNIAPEEFFFYVFLALAAGSVSIAAVVRYTRLGYGLIAIREGEDTARMLGVPTERYKLYGLALCALLTGLTGAAYAFSLGYITTTSVFRSDLSFSVIVYALLGGMGTLAGPVLGAAIMTLLTQVALGNFLHVHMMMTGLVIIALVFLLPNGLMGLLGQSRASPAVIEANGMVGCAAPVVRAAQPVIAGPPILRLVNLSKQFKGLRATDGVDLIVEQGSISTIIGPNGAGKSTIFNLVTGYIRPDCGEIWYEGARIDGLATHRLSRCGIARAFQIASPFAGLSVYENVRVGALFGRDGRRDPHRETVRALALTGLSELAGEAASTLPVGHLRRLEIARVIATRPKLILADEPCAGLNPAETREMMKVLEALKREGATVVLIDHDMQAVMELSDTIFVIAAGRCIAHGPPSEIGRHPAVIEAYLGKALATNDRPEGSMPVAPGSAVS
jgi:branched-chain amino acid transport system permease protein